MIPILYEKDETAFASNGLGRLRDCISCSVTEERNGIYECEFEYPVSGAHFDDIQLGRIIGVEHDTSTDVQPFDIIGVERPIDGKVKFHAVHISYRQRYLVARASNITSLTAAFSALQSALPSNPFIYTSDMVSTGYIAAFDGIPRTVRSLLGGVEGSILDAYGGEYEWDKWSVILHRSRGTERDLTIRYGVNLLDYSEDLDYSESYSAAIPFWKDSNGTIVAGSVVQNPIATYNGRLDCVPLDLSDKFESAPSTANLEAMAQQIMQGGQTYLPTQTIKVDFLRLQDTTEYASLATLFDCKLCDTVEVVFPRYGMQGRFKIVKTVYDVLQERYSEMELGTLSTSLAEALGITPSLDGVQSKEYDDFVVDQGVLSQASGEWMYTKWDSGRYELSCYLHDLSLSHYASQGGFYGYQYTIGWSGTFPDFISTDYSAVHSAQVGNGFTMPAAQLSKSTSSITLVALASVSGAQSVSFSCQMIGRWK